MRRPCLVLEFEDFEDIEELRRRFQDIPENLTWGFTRPATLKGAANSIASRIPPGLLGGGGIDGCSKFPGLGCILHAKMVPGLSPRLEFH